jgi:3-phosphoshikimate 1-carboxyvinyltransferase
MELRVTASARGLNGTIRVPGDKSITHRALLFGAMADGTTRLSGAMRAGVIERWRLPGSAGVEIERAQAMRRSLVGSAGRRPTGSWTAGTRPPRCGC